MVESVGSWRRPAHGRRDGIYRRWKVEGMAQGFLSAIGSEYGPCADEACEHAYCASGRELLALECRICGEVVGADVGFFHEVGAGGRSWEVLVHALCRYGEIDEKRAASDSL